MKKADNFDASKWLVENKITTQSKLNEEETMTLEQMNSLSIDIIKKLKQLQQIVKKMENGSIDPKELIRLNTIPDNQFHSFRFISDDLSEFSKTFDSLRDYGIEN
jgi:uncharacterized membrane protein YjjP (DUF1212 family)